MLPSDLLDAVDVANFVVGTIAAVAAVVAIILSGIAYRAIARERRTVFELELLRELLVSDINKYATVPMEVRACVACLPRDDLPLINARIDAEDRGQHGPAILDAALVFRGDTPVTLTRKRPVLSPSSRRSSRRSPDASRQSPMPPNPSQTHSRLIYLTHIRATLQSGVPSLAAGVAADLARP